MRRITVVLPAVVAAIVTAGGAIAQQQVNTQSRNPAVYGSPGLQAGGGCRQTAANNQRGYPQGGQMMAGSYNPRAAQNGLTPTNCLANKNPFGTAARGGGMQPSAQGVAARSFNQRN